MVPGLTLDMLQALTEPTLTAAPSLMPLEPPQAKAA